MPIKKENRSLDKADQISSLVLNEKIRDQNQFLTSLKKQGICMTQATLSRWLKKMGIYKENGFYRLQRKTVFKSIGQPIQAIIPAPPNLILIHTSPGYASALAARIDTLLQINKEAPTIQHILGTLAGDDAVLVITKPDTYTQEMKNFLMDCF